METNYSIDHENYKLYRPTYGSEIYDFIKEIISDNSLAWDCACGSGQATNELAKIFKMVVATDVDSNQLSKSSKIENVEYLQCGEFNNSLKDESVDFISVATGIHWLDTDKFYKESERVLKKGGILGVWGYTGVNIHPDIDPVFKEIVAEYLMPYYPESIKIAFNRYVDIELPFEQIKSRNYTIVKKWNFLEFKSYILSFTAMQTYKAKMGECGFYRFEDKLLAAWGGNQFQKKELKWEIITKFSKK